MGMGIFEDQLIGLVFGQPAPRPTQIIGLLVCSENFRGDVDIQIPVDRKHQVRVAIQELDHQQDSVHRSADSPHHILGIRGSVEFQVSDIFWYLAVRLMIHPAFIKTERARLIPGSCTGSMLPPYSLRVLSFHSVMGGVEGTGGTRSSDPHDSGFPHHDLGWQDLDQGSNPHLA